MSEDSEEYHPLSLLRPVSKKGKDCNACMLSPRCSGVSKRVATNHMGLFTFKLNKI